ncbi:MAG: HPF/RaiA family ribosome-associated protein [Myxococcales bacterium]|nr:HPF/RaiA family ribosome-associated protein [Myxococcales bacterium]
MKIEIRFRSIAANDELEEHAVRRVHLELARFGREVDAVVVRIADVNGPRGGVDKRCQVTVSGRRVGAVAVDGRHEDAFAAVSLALGRGARAVGRGLERSRAARREASASARSVTELGPSPLGRAS